MRRTLTGALFPQLLLEALVELGVLLLGVFERAAVVGVVQLGGLDVRELKDGGERLQRGHALKVDVLNPNEPVSR